ncbi:MAG TPA: DegV family protein [Ruminococcaceae bacterium]|nr:DegV family protein [Oscillospiraceae bacterium]
MEELEKWALGRRQAVCHCFKVDELDHLRRGGRISATTAIVGSALQIKPILVVNPEGKLQPIAKVRGRRRAMEYLLNAVKKNLLDDEESETLFIGHGDDLGEAIALKKAVQAECPHVKKVFVVPLSPIIGTHVGPGMIDILFYGKDRMCKI